MPKINKIFTFPLLNKHGNIVGLIKIDSRNSSKVLKHHWYKSKDGYAVSHIKGGPPKTMHNFLFGNFYKEGIHLDHINRDKLDNRKSNIRKVTHSQNKMNRPAPSDNKSGVKGVCFDKNRNKWLATMLIRGKFQIIKRFKNKSDAIKYRKLLEKKHFKQYNYERNPTQ